MSVNSWYKHLGLFAATVLIAALFCFTAAGAETAEDITDRCSFKTGSGKSPEPV